VVLVVGKDVLDALQGQGAWLVAEAWGLAELAANAAASDGE